MNEFGSRNATNYLQRCPHSVDSCNKRSAPRELVTLQLLRNNHEHPGFEASDWVVGKTTQVYLFGKHVGSILVPTADVDPDPDADADADSDVEYDEKVYRLVSAPAAGSWTAAAPCLSQARPRPRCRASATPWGCSSTGAA